MILFPDLLSVAKKVLTKPVNKCSQLVLIAKTTQMFNKLCIHEMEYYLAIKRDY